MAEPRDCRDLLRRPEAKDGENGGYGKKVIDRHIVNLDSCSWRPSRQNFVPDDPTNRALNVKSAPMEIECIVISY